MKARLIKLFLLSVLMLPQLAAAFPNLNKADEIAPLVAALVNDNERVTIDGVRYKIAFESDVFKETFIKQITSQFDLVRAQHGTKINPSFVKKVLPIIAKLLQDTYTKNDVWQVVKALDSSISRQNFDMGYSDFKQSIINPMQAAFKMKSADAQKFSLDLYTLKSFLGYEKTDCVNNKQSYEIKGFSSSSRFTLIAPKKTKTIEPKASSSTTSTTKPKATSDVKKADKKKDKKAAKKAKKKAKKKTKKAAKKNEK